MKKRSILAATAMLLVAILAATGATYAWFTNTSDAKAEISMNVASGTSLEISFDGTTWYSTLEWVDQYPSFEWNDLSTTNGVDFYEEVYETDTTTIIGYQPAGTTTPVQTGMIHFRSTESGNVKVAPAATFEHKVEGTTKVAKSDALRLAITDLSDNATTIYGNTTATGKGVASDGTGAALDTYEGAQAVKAIGGAENVVKLAALPTHDGYYYGKANFTFWIEGLIANNSNAGGSGVITLTFGQ